jgi:hypothetical protein
MSESLVVESGIYMKEIKDPTEIYAEYIGESELAIHISGGDSYCWLPKSQINYQKMTDNGKMYVEIEMPIWLAKNKELI